MQEDDLVTEWLVGWEEARTTDQPPPALDRLPAELRPRAREGLRLLRGFARMSHGLAANAPPERRRPAGAAGHAALPLRGIFGPGRHGRSLARLRHAAGPA